MQTSHTTADRIKLADDVRGIASGDRGALRRVYECTSAKVYGICFHVLRDPELSEDVLQQVYLKVWQRAEDFDPARSSPITWLCVIARNTAIDWQRSMRRHADAVGVAHATHLIDIAQPVADPARRDALHRCMDELETGRRDYIHLAFFEGFTYSELAERAVVPLGTVKSWIRRALIQLRECIEHD